MLMLNVSFDFTAITVNPCVGVLAQVPLICFLSRAIPDSGDDWSCFIVCCLWWDC